MMEQFEKWYADQDSVTRVGSAKCDLRKAFLSARALALEEAANVCDQIYGDAEGSAQERIAIKCAAAIRRLENR